jgi:murein L,D-transpeptidase YcbB/YkuD
MCPEITNGKTMILKKITNSSATDSFNLRLTCLPVIFMGLLALASLTMPIFAMEANQNESDRIRALILARQKAGGFTCAGEMICGISLLPEFYRRREFQPAWTLSGKIGHEAREMVDVLREIDGYGLRSSDYHLQNIERLAAEISSKPPGDRPLETQRLAELDILLTDAFLLLSSHLYGGRVNPETIHSEWVAFQYDINLIRVLEAALEQDRVRQALNKLHPPHAGYNGIRKALDIYQQIAIAGGWPQVPHGPSLRLGDENESVILLRQRLFLSGDIGAYEPVNPLQYDRILEAGVRRFQERHGLEKDGIVGKETLRSLNISVTERIRQLQVNLERWRWIPHDLGERYLLVNIADFTLTVMEQEKPVSDMKVIVGRPFRKTPVFSKKMTFLVFNPYWNVPHSLAVQDILPKIKEDPEFISKKGFTLFSSWADDAPEVDPATIDWSLLDKGNFPYRLRQKPGPNNALGTVKFMFPNKFAVYLHDTPSQNLFKSVTRDFSSGCIRVEKPVWLADYVLRGQGGWSEEKIREVIAGGENKVVSLQHPIDVHLLYWTAWVDEEGSVQFRDDIYDRDRPLALALKERLPPS